MFVVHLQAGMKAFREKILADTLEGKLSGFFLWPFKDGIMFINFYLIFSPKAFVAALYVDKGLRHVEVFCRVCLFPRLEVKTTFDNLIPTFLPTQSSTSHLHSWFLCVCRNATLLPTGGALRDDTKRLLIHGSFYVVVGVSFGRLVLQPRSQGFWLFSTRLAKIR